MVLYSMCPLLEADAEGDRMIFTDDDLERLKFSLGTLYIPTINPKILDAMIVRLEAAERIIKAIDPEEVAQVHENFVAWLKASGK